MGASPVYPRVGGGNSLLVHVARRCLGLSPRERGKHGSAPSRTSAPGSIPAWAGETLQRGGELVFVEVYPRVGGGNALPKAAAAMKGGLSPRGRGKRARGCPKSRAWRSIPAWAGETFANFRPQPARKVYPRVGGGNAGARAAYVDSEGLSPRGRGKPQRIRRRALGLRSIPAWAGETEIYPKEVGDRRVYPRVGGGNLGKLGFGMFFIGLSPRGRGKR